MKLKVLFVSIFMILILINIPVSAQRLNVEILISNYGYGQEPRSPVNKVGQTQLVPVFKGTVYIPGQL